MSKSRYAATPVINRHHYGTWSLPSYALGYRPADILAGVRTFDYTIQLGDRADTLAARYLGDDGYWWVICVGNGIPYPFASGGFKPGRVIKIPMDAADVLGKIVR